MLEDRSGVCADADADKVEVAVAIAMTTRSSGSDEAQLRYLFSANGAPSSLAWGNAPGNRLPNNKALKARPQRDRAWPAYTG